MKSYESSERISDGSPCVLRMDGHCFSKFTQGQGFDRPFDHGFHECMVATSEDLLRYFPESTLAYTQSDEVTLVFPRGMQMFGGRTHKVVSLAAGYTSTRFNHHLNFLLPEKHAARGEAHFDARFYAVSDVAELLNCLLWRCRTDCQKNAKLRFARHHWHVEDLAQISGKTADEAVSMVESATGVNYVTATPAWARNGTLLKRRQVSRVGVDPRTGLEKVTARVVVCAIDMPVVAFDEANLALVTEPYLSLVTEPPWNETQKR
jgi:tRNA(His) guanylyltransferase